jgi:hypothetical protein
MMNYQTTTTTTTTTPKSLASSIIVWLLLMGTMNLDICIVDSLQQTTTTTTTTPKTPKKTTIMIMDTVVTPNTIIATTTRRAWFRQTAVSGMAVMTTTTMLPRQPSFAATTTTTKNPLQRLLEAQDTLDTLLSNWKRATVDCTFADVPRELLETKNKELLLEKASTFALFDKSVSVESCKTTNRIVRDYLGLTGKGPLVGIDKVLRKGFDALKDPDDMDDYVVGE